MPTTKKTTAAKKSSSKDDPEVKDPHVIEDIVLDDPNETVLGKDIDSDDLATLMSELDVLKASRSINSSFAFSGISPREHQYEYKFVLIFPHDGNGASVQGAKPRPLSEGEEVMNRLGKLGWRLKEVLMPNLQPSYQYMVNVMEREIIEPLEEGEIPEGLVEVA